MLGFSSTRTTRSFSAGLPSSCAPPSLYIRLGFLRTKCRTCTLLCWTSLDSPRPTFQVCWGVSEWQPFLPLCQLHDSVWCHQQTCWGALNSFIGVIDKNVEEHQSQDRPLGNTACYWPPSGHRTIDHHPLSVSFQPIPYPLGGPPITSTSLQTWFYRIRMFQSLTTRLYCYLFIHYPSPFLSFWMIFYEDAYYNL